MSEDVTIQFSNCCSMVIAVSLLTFTMRKSSKWRRKACEMYRSSAKGAQRRAKLKIKLGKKVMVVVREPLSFQSKTRLGK